jgi:hypothetical protein
MDAENDIPTALSAIEKIRQAAQATCTSDTSSVPTPTPQALKPSENRHRIEQSEYEFIGVEQWSPDKSQFELRVKRETLINQRSDRSLPVLAYWTEPRESPSTSATPAASAATNFTHSSAPHCPHTPTPTTPTSHRHQRHTPSATGAARVTLPPALVAALQPINIIFDQQS